LIASLRRASILPRGVAYISTTGVYGDAAGAFIDETQPIRPLSDRAVRRADAEGQLRHWGRHGTRVALLRAPGIYAANRLPVDRIQTGTPAILDAEDSYSNHIHADDLAMAAALSLFRGNAQRTYNVCDQSRWKMGEWFDRVADACGLARPPRLSRAEAKVRVSPALWSFMRESRQLDHTRLRFELRIRLRYPTPEVLLTALADQLRKS
jgi:nucleoside-diphosphate-sugar epimerase